MASRGLWLLLILTGGNEQSNNNVLRGLDPIT